MILQTLIDTALEQQASLISLMVILSGILRSYKDAFYGVEFIR